MNKKTLVTILVATATVAGCGKEPAPSVPTSTTAQQPPAAATRNAPTTQTLGTDRANADRVATDFVTILETHDTSVDEEEWSSLHRAADLMESTMAKQQLAYPQGDVMSQWKKWKQADAFVEPRVSITHDKRPKDTATTAVRVLRAQLDVQVAADEKPLPLQERVHFVTMRKHGDTWVVEQWTTGPLEEAHVQEAGKETKTPTPGKAPR